MVSRGSESDAGIGHPLSRYTSIHNSNASRAFARASSSVLPEVTSPGNAEHRTLYPPSDDGWKVHTYCALIVLMVSSRLFMSAILSQQSSLSTLIAQPVSLTVTVPRWAQSGTVYCSHPVASPSLSTAAGTCFGCAVSSLCLQEFYKIVCRGNAQAPRRSHLAGRQPAEHSPVLRVSVLQFCGCAPRPLRRRGRRTDDSTRPTPGAFGMRCVSGWRSSRCCCTRTRPD